MTVIEGRLISIEILDPSPRARDTVLAQILESETDDTYAVYVVDPEPIDVRTVFPLARGPNIGVLRKTRVFHRRYLLRRGQLPLVVWTEHT